MGDASTLIITLVAVMILLLLFAAIAILFSVFVKRKNGLINERIEAQKRFEQVIAETQIEIREETLRNISWELHDNIGQLLTLAKIKAQNISDGKEMEEVAETIGTGLNELRALSRSINPEAVNKLSFESLLNNEIKRFNRLQFVDATFNIDGEVRSLNKKVGIILFRILQEFFSNTIKHSRAKNLMVSLKYTQDTLVITAEDDGEGFDLDNINQGGIGLVNMKKRAELINAQFHMFSQLGEGTRLKIIYKF